MTTSTELLAAHRAGRDYARELHASHKAARALVRHAYTTEEERFTFLAGYRGELHRMTCAALDLPFAETPFQTK